MERAGEAIQGVVESLTGNAKDAEADVHKEVASQKKDEMLGNKK